MESQQSDDLTPEEQMVNEEETLEGALPFDEYGKDTEQLRGQIERLVKEYDQREKVIDRIMEFGTGIETEKALRMYPTPVLRKWEDSLETYRASKLKKQ
jgi:hypothetical protein